MSRTPKKNNLQNNVVLLTIVLLSTVLNFNVNAANNTRQHINFNNEWRFKLDDNDKYKDEALNDSGWTLLDVPHDYIFEEGVHKAGSQGQSGGYHGGGTAWYRKHFTYDESWQGKLRVCNKPEGILPHPGHAL